VRLDIRYQTQFRYAHPVRESNNELRACPTTDDRQQLVSYRLTTRPAARVLATTDYWGTRVDAFGMRAPHRELEIAAESTVETFPGRIMAAAPTLAQLSDPLFREEHIEYLERTAHVDWGPNVEAEARRRAEPLGDDVAGVLLSLYRAGGTLLRYVPGATFVGMPVDEVLACGEGVCQDFTHLAIALCRSVGIPARYVSGYLFATDDATGAAGDADTVVVQTHAWIEVALPGAGWWALDPTNHQEVGEQHVKIGHGRDYDDVPPLRGVFSGPAEHEMDVEVEMRRVAAAQQQQ
jgi:transglutaminase-like putative cysteine protease